MTSPRAEREAKDPAAVEDSREEVRRVFQEAEQASRGVEALVDAHFTLRDIDVVLEDREGRHRVPIRHHTGIPYTAALGILGGGTLGGFVAAELAEAALLRGIALGALGGAIFGAVAGLGFWQKKPDLSPKDTRDGSVLVKVRASDARAAQARSILEQHGGRSSSDER